jgi:hypothetical protein
MERLLTDAHDEQDMTAPNDPPSTDEAPAQREHALRSWRGEPPRNAMTAAVRRALQADTGGRSGATVIADALRIAPRK